LAIGVSKKNIMKDYMLSKVYIEPMIKRMTTKIRLLSLFRADISQLRKLLDTRAEYLNATFNAIDRKFDSPGAFFNFLGIGFDKREKLRQLLCS
jgi:protein tyrosine/serine phosphatase